MNKDQWEELSPEERQGRLDAIAQREREALTPREDDGPETNDDDDHQHIDVEDCFDCPFYESHLMFHECVLDGDVEPDGVILPDDCPLRTRSVVVHGVWEKEQTPDEGEEEYVGVGLVNPRHVEQFKLRAESLKEPAKEGREDQARLEITERLRHVLMRVSEEDVADLEKTAQQIENSRALRKQLEVKDE